MHFEKKILIIQTAFIGDVILATPIIEALHRTNPNFNIDFLLRKGNEPLLSGHPKINKLFIWDKKKDKYKNLFKVINQIRHEKYDIVINLQRFASTGFITVFSAGRIKIGFKSNPLSFLFSYRIIHRWGNFVHETERNLSLLEPIFGKLNAKMALYPQIEIIESVKKYQQQPYICIAPTSVWFTKQFPIKRWIELIDLVPEKFIVYLIGAPSDFSACEEIIKETNHQHVINLCKDLNLLQSAVLMKGAILNYVNDSAPLHLASAMNAPVAAIFCSTIPSFGFGPLSDCSVIIETSEKLSCRPCGMHGFKACPEKHYRCGYSIKTSKLLEPLKQIDNTV